MMNYLSADNVENLSLPLELESPTAPSLINHPFTFSVNNKNAPKRKIHKTQSVQNFMNISKDDNVQQPSPIRSSQSLPVFNIITDMVSDYDMKQSTLNTSNHINNESKVDTNSNNSKEYKDNDNLLYNTDQNQIGCLHDQRFTIQHIKHITSALRTPIYGNLIELDLSGNCFGERGILKLCTAFSLLPSGHLPLKVLNLSDTGLNDMCVGIIAIMLQTDCTLSKTLQSLILSSNNKKYIKYYQKNKIHEMLQEIADELRGVCVVEWHIEPRFQSYEYKDSCLNNITNVGANMLTDFLLLNNNNTLKYVDLYGNNIGADGIESLMIALSDSKCTISMLKMCFTNIKATLKDSILQCFMSSESSLCYFDFGSLKVIKLQNHIYPQPLLSSCHHILNNRKVNSNLTFQPLLNNLMNTTQNDIDTSQTDNNSLNMQSQIFKHVPIDKTDELQELDKMLGAIKKETHKQHSSIINNVILAKQHNHSNKLIDDLDQIETISHIRTKPLLKETIHSKFSQKKKKLKKLSSSRNKHKQFRKKSKKQKRMKRDNSPIRMKRDNSPIRMKRDNSPIRMKRDNSPIRMKRDNSPIRYSKRDIPVGRLSSIWRTDTIWSPYHKLKIKKKSSHGKCKKSMINRYSNTKVAEELGRLIDLQNYVSYERSPLYKRTLHDLKKLDQMLEDCKRDLLNTENPDNESSPITNYTTNKISVVSKNTSNEIQINNDTVSRNNLVNKNNGNSKITNKDKDNAEVHNAINKKVNENLDQHINNDNNQHMKDDNNQHINNDNSEKTNKGVNVSSENTKVLNNIDDSNEMESKYSADSDHESDKDSIKVEKDVKANKNDNELEDDKVSRSTSMNSIQSNNQIEVLKWHTDSGWRSKDDIQLKLLTDSVKHQQEEVKIETTTTNDINNVKLSQYEQWKMLYA